MVEDETMDKEYGTQGADNKEQSLEEPAHTNGENGTQKVSENEEQSSGEYTYTGEQRNKWPEEKEGIAKYVVTYLIESATAIFLDAGSTVEEVAKEIFSRDKEDRDSKRSLTIMTNNMGISRDFNKALDKGGPDPRLALTLLLTGGIYDIDHDALFGSQAATALENFYPHAVIIGTSGLMFDSQDSQDSQSSNRPGGLFYHGHTPEEVVKKAIFHKPTIRRIIVCDFSKIGQWDSFLCGEIKELPRGVQECIVVTSTVPETLSKDWYDYYNKRFELELEKVKKLRASNSDFERKVKLVRVDPDGSVETSIPEQIVDDKGQIVSMPPQIETDNGNDAIDEV